MSVTIHKGSDLMHQVAPYPHALADLIAGLTYREGWTFALQDTERGQDSEGLTFSAIGTYPDTYNPERMIRVQHLFIVPAASYNEQSWRRWLFDRICEIERHEAAEFFQINGERPYAPNHGPGHDPYFLIPQELTDAGTRRVRFDGSVAPEEGAVSDAERLQEAIAQHHATIRAAGEIRVQDAASEARAATKQAADRELWSSIGEAD